MEAAPRRGIKICCCSCICNYGLGILPILFGVCVMTTFIITYIIAVSDGHIYPYFPTISDTGGEKPESNIFGLLLSICSFLGFIVVLIRFIQFKHISENNELIVSRIFLINKIALFFGIVSCFGAVVVANFQDRGKSAEAHVVGAAFVFGGGVVYCCFQTYLTASILECGSNSRCLYYARLILCFASVILFILFAILFYLSNKAKPSQLLATWKSTDPGYIMHIINSLSEWFCALCLMIYFISFSGEFRKVQIDFAVKRNESYVLPFQISTEDIGDLSGYQSVPRFV